MILDLVVSKGWILGINKKYWSQIDKNEFSVYEEEYEKNTTLMYRPPEMADLY